MDYATNNSQVGLFAVRPQCHTTCHPKLEAMHWKPKYQGVIGLSNEARYVMQLIGSICQLVLCTLVPLLRF